MSHQIVVDRHDGSLTVDSSPGETTFHVSLPLTKKR
jgi:nitrogen-specific signal transduction histidine kinase